MCKPKTPGLPWPPLEPEGEFIDITLVPIGFTQIRMTFLPVLEVESGQETIKHGMHKDDI